MIVGLVGNAVFMSLFGVSGNYVQAVGFQSRGFEKSGFVLVL